MEVLVVNREEVARLLPMTECIAVVEEALVALARDEATQPLRPVMWLPDRRGALGLMPGHLAGRAAMAAKVISVFPGNLGTGYDSHQGAVLLFETDHGRLLSICDASEITAIRTAATSAVATRALARPEASRLAILGSGVQAASHLEAMLAVRPIETVRVWSRDRARAGTFVDHQRGRHPIELTATPTPAAAVAGADVVCTTTAATEPVLLGADLTPGTHINAVGSSVPFARELDGAAMAAARLFVDRRESTLAEAGDFLLARAEGAVDDDHILAELGEVLAGRHPGRRSDDEITLFESVGIAVEDVAAAHHVTRRAMAEGAGTRVELGGERYGA